MVSHTKWMIGPSSTANPSAQGVISESGSNQFMSIEKIAVLGADRWAMGLLKWPLAPSAEVTSRHQTRILDKGIATIEKSLSKLIIEERMSQGILDAAVLEQVLPMAQLLMRIWSSRRFLKFQISNSQPNPDWSSCKKAPFSPVTQVASVSINCCVHKSSQSSDWYAFHNSPHKLIEVINGSDTDAEVTKL